MCYMQSPKDCVSLLFNFLCLETQGEKDKAIYTNEVYLSFEFK